MGELLQAAGRRALLDSTIMTSMEKRPKASCLVGAEGILLFRFMLQNGIEKGVFGVAQAMAWLGL